MHRHMRIHAYALYTRMQVQVHMHTPNSHRPHPPPLRGLWCPSLPPPQKKTHVPGAENIRFYAALRGFSPADVEAVVGEVGRHLDMGPHLHKPVRTYSGGTARKLSFVIACLSHPAILFLGAWGPGLERWGRRQGRLPCLFARWRSGAGVSGTRGGGGSRLGVFG
jgi:hypothetical protein